MSQPIISLLAATLVFSSGAFAASVNQADLDAIEKRIQPVGQVYLAGSEPAAAEPAGPRDGATVYNTFCTACHTSGISNAPIKGNADQWQPRLAQGRDIVNNHAINGFNAMPAKGSCMDCSDDEIVAAIDYMVEGL